MPAPVRLAAALFFGLVLFVGLPLFAWGITDIQGFTADPARSGYVVVIVVLQVVVTLAFPGAGRTGGKGVKLVRRQQVAILLLQVISLAMILAVPYGDRREIAVMGDSEVIRCTGLILFAAGFLLMNWSEAALGRQFSIQVTIQEGHRLITEGPYRLLRHPRYLGIVVFNLGIALTFRSWLGAALAFVLLGVLLWRIHDEEALMRQEFGTEWDAYASHSWHLIPLVY